MNLEINVPRTGTECAVIAISSTVICRFKTRHKQLPASNLGQLNSLAGPDFYNLKMGIVRPVSFVCVKIKSVANLDLFPELSFICLLITSACLSHRRLKPTTSKTKFLIFSPPLHRFLFLHLSCCLAAPTKNPKATSDSPHTLDPRSKPRAGLLSELIGLFHPPAPATSPSLFPR